MPQHGCSPRALFPGCPGPAEDAAGEGPDASGMSPSLLCCPAPRGPCWRGVALPGPPALPAAPRRARKGCQPFRAAPPAAGIRLHPGTPRRGQGRFRRGLRAAVGTWAGVVLPRGGLGLNACVCPAPRVSCPARVPVTEVAATSPFPAGMESLSGCWGTGGAPLGSSGAVGCSPMLWDEKGGLKPPGAGSARRGSRVPGGAVPAWHKDWGLWVSHRLQIRVPVGPTSRLGWARRRWLRAPGRERDGFCSARAHHGWVPLRALLPFCPGASVGAGVALPGGGFGAVSPRGHAGDVVLFPTAGTGTAQGWRRMLQERGWRENTSDLSFPAHSAPLLPPGPPPFPSGTVPAQQAPAESTSPGLGRGRCVGARVMSVNLFLVSQQTSWNLEGAL